MVVFSSYPHDARPRRAVDALLQEGMSIDLLCEADGKAPRRESLGNLNVIRIPIPRTRGGKLSYAYQYSAFITVATSIFAWRSLRKRYDLLYVHNMPDVLVISALFPKTLGARVILDQHDPMPELMTTIFNLDDRSLSVRAIRWLEKWSLARANTVITVNEACRRLFSSRGCPVEKIGVVMNTPDEQLFPYRDAHTYPASRAKDRPFVIMYHGSLVERNGLDLAVEALAIAKKNLPSAELRIFGRTTPFLEQVMERSRSLGLQDSVKFLGPKRLEDLAQEIQSCDVGVIPNQRNAFTDINTPVRIFEYLALGKPVIAPQTPGIQDYFDREALFFFESGNASDLAQQLEYVYSNPGTIGDVAARGQQVYLNHTWQQERETFVRLVSRTLKLSPA
jgi:glycosyltransferase involved in cell wall biosynthesis